jgi:hypothetical protein
MAKQFIRVGNDKLNVRTRLNLLFGARHEFVYLSDFLPWQRVNGTWTGALGHLMNDNCMDWKAECAC